MTRNVRFPKVQKEVTSQDVEVLRARLLHDALEKPVRRRNDVDITVLVQFLLRIEALSQVPLPALYYFASEATLLNLQDGDVLWYQEDPVTIDSAAYIVIEGSICGYFNRAFSHREDESENFQTWNGKQIKKKGVLIDFGEFQAAFSQGALCGFEDLMGNEKRKRKRGIHAQEAIVVISIRKDTLDHATRRFGLVFEKGALKLKSASDESSNSTSTASSSSTSVDTCTHDDAHENFMKCALFNQLSATSKKKLYQDAPRRHFSKAEVIFPAQSGINAFLIVLSGSIDLRWETVPSSNDQENPVLLSLHRGEFLGEQALSLGIYDSQQVSVTSSDHGTELLWISRDFLEEKFLSERLSWFPPQSFDVWAKDFFTDKESNSKSLFYERDPENISQLSSILWCHTSLQSFFFQFPPLLIDRFCADMELCTFDRHGIFKREEEELHGIYVVVQGSVRGIAPEVATILYPPDADQTQLDANIPKPLSSNHLYQPGDAFGQEELRDKTTTSFPFFVEQNTILLMIPQVLFDRWILPSYDNLNFHPGTTFQMLTNNAVEKRSRFNASSGRHQSTAVQMSQVAVQNMAPVAELLKRMGYFRGLPRFLVKGLLQQTKYIQKQTGDVIFKELDESQSLVIIISGRLGFFSKENISATMEMFQGHSFCRFYPVRTDVRSTCEENFLQGISPSENGSSPSKVSIRMARRGPNSVFGVQIQSLEARNAFRVGVLEDGFVSPATVIAQTPCELLIIDDAFYNQVLKRHVAALDLDKYEAPPVHVPNAASSENKQNAEPTLSIGGGVSAATSTPQISQPVTALSLTFMKYLEPLVSPWMNHCMSKTQLLLREMQLIKVKGNEKLMKNRDPMENLYIVFNGKLTVHIVQSRESSTFLDASQRSVRSLMLERSVTSNYMTTSRQLFQQQGSESPRGKLTRVLEQGGSESPHGTNSSSRRVLNLSSAGPNSPRSPRPPPRHLSTMKAQPKARKQSVFLCSLGPGDIFGEEIFDQSLQFSDDEVFTDSSSLPSNGFVELLWLKRKTYHEILDKTEEEASEELRMRSRMTIAKWQMIEKKVKETIVRNNPGRPKLFDIFKNILNQRCYLTMRAIGELPMFRDIPEWKKKAICIVARFEAVEKHASAYEDRHIIPVVGGKRMTLMNMNGSFRTNSPILSSESSSDTVNAQAISDFRYFVVLTGRVALWTKPHASVQVCLREIGVGEGFGEFELLSRISTRTITAVALENTKLLSFPAYSFLNRWPTLDTMHKNLLSVQSLERLFGPLDHEKLSFLYHSFTFEDFSRGTKILEDGMTPPSKSQLYILKEGDCIIKHRLKFLAIEKDNTLPADRKNIMSPSLEMLVTVSQVSAGHLIWIEEGKISFTCLEVVSSNVSMAMIPLEKIKAILSRSQMLAIERNIRLFNHHYQEQLQKIQNGLFSILDPSSSSSSNFAEEHTGQSKISRSIALNPTALKNRWSNVAASTTVRKRTELSTLLSTQATQPSTKEPENNSVPTPEQKEPTTPSKPSLPDQYHLESTLPGFFLRGSFGAPSKALVNQEPSAESESTVDPTDVVDSVFLSQAAFDLTSAIKLNTMKENESRDGSFVQEERDGGLRLLRFSPSQRKAKAMGKHEANPAAISRPSVQLSDSSRDGRLDGSQRRIFRALPGADMIKSKFPTNKKKNPSVLLVQEQSFLQVYHHQHSSSSASDVGLTYEEIFDLLTQYDGMSSRSSVIKRRFFSLENNHLIEFAHDIQLTKIHETKPMNTYILPKEVEVLDLMHLLLQEEKEQRQLDESSSTSTSIIEAVPIIRNTFVLKWKQITLILIADTEVKKKHWIKMITRACQADTAISPFVLLKQQQRSTTSSMRPSSVRTSTGSPQRPSCGFQVEYRFS